MRILILEPFFAGSHQQWIEDLRSHSSHEIDLLTLEGRNWRWRMKAAAITLARQYLDEAHRPDLILCSDMLDLSTFQSLTRRETHDVPFAIYFHENQLVYPWKNEEDKVVKKVRDEFAFINFRSALSADRVFFNSRFHYRSFFEAFLSFLDRAPDHPEKESLESIHQKSEVLPLALDLEKFDAFHETQRESSPLILWNHRWEFDKDPSTFFKVLTELEKEGMDFRLAVLGEASGNMPEAFREAQISLKDRIDMFGYASSFADYAQWLWKADLLPVTSRQDFFGISAVEAIYCETYPLLPDRLAFPSHIPEGEHAAHLYSSETDLKAKLRSALQNIDKCREKKMRSFVSHYDIRKRISEFDEQMKKLKGAV